MPSSPENTAPETGAGAEARTGWTWAGWAALAGLIALRIVYAFHYRTDSDEPQHLHVVWGWANGMVQYRDFFDNHTPLFQMLCAPLFHALGVHAWIAIPMRLAMLPLFLVDLYLIYRIAGRLFAPRVAQWATLFAGFLPAFCLVTTEFRTDDLWTLLWFAALAIALGGPILGQRAFWLGLVFGACTATSMKTSLLMASLGGAGLGVLLLARLAGRPLQFRPYFKSALLIALGGVIVPGVLIAFFAARHALPDLYYCVIKHNSVPGLGKWNKTGFHLFYFPIALPFLMAAGWACMKTAPSPATGARRALLLLTYGFFVTLLKSYWPLITAQDYVPVAPLAVILATGLLFAALDRAGRYAPALTAAAVCLVLGGEVHAMWRLQSPLDDEMAPFTSMISSILRLTDPGDLVMDGKGETIFRKRPIRWVLEGITITRIQKGLLPDDVIPRMIETNTCVALDHRMRPQDKAWLRKNFVDGENKIWIAGQKLGPNQPQIAFRNDIAANYSFISDSGEPVAGTLDGKPLQHSQFIPAGTHELRLEPGKGQIAFLWSQALDRGFDCFGKDASHS